MSRRVAVASVALILAACAATAWAHARLVRAIPAPGSVVPRPPSVIRVWFSDELDVRRSGISVWNTRGQRVDNARGGVDLDDLDRKSMKTTLKPIGSGRYTVRWRAVSADDLFVAGGSFTFSVRAPSR